MLVARIKLKVTLKLIFCAWWLTLVEQPFAGNLEVHGFDQESSAASTLATLLPRDSIEALNEARGDIAIATDAESLKDLIISQNDQLIAIIAVNIEYIRYQELMNSQELKNADKTKVTAIYSDPNPTLQLELAKILIGVHARIGAGYEAENLKPVRNLFDGEKQHIQLIEATPPNLRSFLPNLDEIDALIAIPQRELYNGTTIPPIIRSLYRRNKFLIGYSQRMVDLGSLASVHSTVEDLEKSIRETVEQILSTGSIPEPAFSSNWSISINQNLARSINLRNVNKEEIKNDLLRKQAGTDQ